jgi:hypothetical protein
MKNKRDGYEREARRLRRLIMRLLAEFAEFTGEQAVAIGPVYTDYIEQQLVRALRRAAAGKYKAR